MRHFHARLAPAANPLRRQQRLWPLTNLLLVGSPLTSSLSTGLLMILFGTLLSCTVSTCMVFSQEASKPAPDALSLNQQQVAERFKKLEDLLLRSAELEAGENPTRSALLQQAAQMGKQAQLADTLVRAANRLDKKQYSQAIEDQKASRENLKRLLELLQSENREERVREKRDQVRRWIEETDRLLRLQKSLSGRTEGGQDLQQAANDQAKLASKAAEIAQDLGGDPKTNGEQKSPEKTPENTPDSSAKDKPAEKPTNDPAKSAEEKTDGKSQDGKSQDGKSQDGKSQDGKSQDGKSQDGKSQDGKSQDGKSQDGKSQDGKSQDGKQPDDKSEAQGQDKSGEREQSDKSSDKSADKSDGSQGKPSDQSQSQPSESTPSESSDASQSGQQNQAAEPEPKDPTERAKKRIERAQKRMEEARRALDEAQRKGATERQREAEAELRAAIEDLEEILRQLREEEIQRSLASLETRLRRMLEMQTKVLEETKRLQEISGDQAVRQVEIRASNLAKDESKILDEGQRAFLLLREEGSSAAFPEAMEQVNSDIGTVVERLSKADVTTLTTTIEQEIVNALEEMVAALVQVQKDKQEKKDQQQQPGQSQAGEPGEQPLVDKLAELRLVRTLQVRINGRTAALAQMLSDPADAVGQATEADILKEVQKLAERQANIQQVTRTIDQSSRQ